MGAGLLWLTFKDQDLSEVFSKLVEADPFWLALSLVLAILAFISRAIRWVLLMEPLGKKPGKMNALYALLIGYFANLAIPRIGEITRCGILSKSDGIPFNSLIGTVIVERIIDLVMLFLTMSLVAILEFDLLWGFLNSKVLGPLAGKFSFLQSPWFYFGVLFAIVILLIVRKKLNQNSEGKVGGKVRKFLHEIGNGFKTILRMKQNGWFIFHTFFIWFIYFLMTWVCFFCLEPTSHLNANAGIFVLVAGGLGMSAPVQGGIGAYHYIVSQGLQLFNISLTDGIVYATLVHTSQTLLVVVLGCWALVMITFVKKSG